MEHGTLIIDGEAVKASDDGLVQGMLIRFTGSSDPDISHFRDFFTKSTDLGIEIPASVGCYYHHGMDKTIGKKRLTFAHLKAADNDAGIWASAQLDLSDNYQKMIHKMAKAGKIGWSSGAANHLVDRKAIKSGGVTANELLVWPIGEATLTPSPAEPRNMVSVKSIEELLYDDEDEATTEEEELIAGKHISTAEREKVSSQDFGWPSERKYPVRNQDDLDSAVSLIGKAPVEERSKIKTKLVSIAKRKGLKLPKSWAVKADFLTLLDSLDETPRTGFKYADQFDEALESIEAVIERTIGIKSLRADGGQKPISDAMHSRIYRAHSALAQFLAECDPLPNQPDNKTKEVLANVHANLAKVNARRYDGNYLAY